MEWSIQDIGALGEFVGSLAVLLTLGYLAVQTRASRQATDLQTFLTVSGNAGNVISGLLSTNPDAFDVWMKGHSGEPLDERELQMFGLMLETISINGFACLLHASPSPTRSRALAGYAGLITQTWENPNFVALWEGGFWAALSEDQRTAIESYRSAR